MKMTITFDSKDSRAMSCCIGTLHLLMEAADYDAALGQKVVDRLTPLLHRRVSSVLPYIVEREGITDMAELEAIARDAALLKGKYGLGVKSRRELIKAICDTDRADFAKPAGEVR